ncbi:hypothetical protein [Sulfurimonas paralvinellae]|uniref:Uncharacterized protein n=1 Tax=Sulfurimonas paralvinellae TaxID=317658 RepID=A0A7M1BAN2_9BACT|nr:hypothetical protein [Sulfurimonas paralvinellae]QOP46807.1 hypothetical protein FM071_10550 [Sulfurimonas paralvinellae]
MKVEELVYAIVLKNTELRNRFIKEKKNNLVIYNRLEAKVKKHIKEYVTLNNVDASEYYIGLSEKFELKFAPILYCLLFEKSTNKADCKKIKNIKNISRVMKSRRTKTARKYIAKYYFENISKIKLLVEEKKELMKILDNSDEILEENYIDTQHENHNKSQEGKIEISKHATLPLVPSDMEHPYKQELWYTYDDFDTKQEEIYKKFSRVEIFSDLEIEAEGYFDYVFHGANRDILKRGKSSYPEIGMFCVYDEYGNRYPEVRKLSMIREAKKGSATRGYITHNISYIVKKLYKEGIGNGKADIERTIDEILQEWELPKDEVKIGMYCKNLKIFTLEGKEWLNMGFIRKQDLHDYTRPGGKGYRLIRYTQLKEAVEYNDMVAKSKLSFLIDEIHKRYNINETTINFEESCLLLKSINNKWLKTVDSHIIKFQKEQI